MVIEKQAEIDRLNKEKLAEIERLKKEKAELEERLGKIEDKETVDNLRLNEGQGNTILLVGGNKSTHSYDEMIVLSDNQTKWTKLQLKLPYKALGSGAVSHNGEIYLIGGWFGHNLLYKLDKNLEWIRLADMNIGRLELENSCVAWNGFIWVFGGWDKEYAPLKSVERYDPKEDKWTLMSDMLYPRVRAAVALWKEGVIINGGRWGETDVVENLEVGNSRLLPNTPRSLDVHSLVSYKDNLVIMGGRNQGTIFNEVWKLASHEATWEKLPPMKYRTERFAGIALNNQLYAIGGRGADEIRLSRVEIFDGEHWRDGPALPHPLTDMTAVLVSQKLAGCLIAYKP